MWLLEGGADRGNTEHLEIWVSWGSVLRGVVARYSQLQAIFRHLRKSQKGWHSIFPRPDDYSDHCFYRCNHFFRRNRAGHNAAGGAGEADQLPLLLRCPHRAPESPSVSGPAQANLARRGATSEGDSGSGGRSRSIQICQRCPRNGGRRLHTARHC